ncbi:RNA ligase (ATP) [Actinomadura craniellae]|uniref:RNA ligase (ATP) n=1 Tax=Actinomadura craniellae TaxID=2231787 RepID=A0A365H3H8_9ACTN|nr:RNA ligase (ATP) [Actinomadura craniellae]RAY13578.1 RNA ligase (ATP) [Actinomadura craniellae]
MSTLRVTAERLTIHPHDNADALELAQVGLYRAVVAKGTYRTGDWALYIPEGALLPPELIDELGLTGKLAGSARNRVKAVRLRGELSQGIVCSPKAVADVDLATAHAADRDFAADLGVTKWVPEIPVHMAGEMVPAEDLIPWIEIEDVKRHPTIFEPGEPVVATEKVHGTACLFTLAGEQAYVTSKGFGTKRLAILHSETNLYWRAVEAHGVVAAAARIAQRYGADRVGVFGEVYGKGVQDLAYGTDGRGPGYAAFDVAVVDAGGRRWLDPDELAGVLAEVGLPAVPRLYAGPYDQAALLELAGGRETVSGRAAHLREGLVVRPAAERYSPVTGGRAIAKFVSPAYLTRKGGTEYE